MFLYDPLHGFLRARVVSCSHCDIHDPALGAPPSIRTPPDLDRLRASLVRHLEGLANAAPPVIMARPVRVIDVNFGLNNQAQIAAMRVRGVLARLLDLQHEKFNLMVRYKASSDDEVCKKQTHASDFGFASSNIRETSCCTWFAVFV